MFEVYRMVITFSSVLAFLYTLVQGRAVELQHINNYFAFLVFYC